MEAYLIHRLEAYPPQDYEKAVHQTVQEIQTEDVLFKKVLTACLIVAYVSNERRSWKISVWNTIDTIKKLGFVSTPLPPIERRASTEK